MKREVIVHEFKIEKPVTTLLEQRRLIKCLDDEIYGCLVGIGSEKKTMPKVIATVTVSLRWPSVS